MRFGCVHSIKCRVLTAQQNTLTVEAKRGRSQPRGAPLRNAQKQQKQLGQVKRIPTNHMRHACNSRVRDNLRSSDSHTRERSPVLVTVAFTVLVRVIGLATGIRTTFHTRASPVRLAVLGLRQLSQDSPLTTKGASG